jgi:hypothetical protein
MDVLVRHAEPLASGLAADWSVLGCAADTQRYSVGVGKLSSDGARRIGKAIARITEFMMPRQGFYSRGGAPTARTMSSEHWDEIYAPLSRLKQGFDSPRERHATLFHAPLRFCAMAFAMLS